MTWPPRIPWWVSPLAIAVAALAVVWALQSARTATADLAAAKERHKAELAGVNVAHLVEMGELLTSLMEEAAASAALTEEIARLKAALPDAKPIATAHGSTGRIRVGPAAGGTVASSPPAAAPGASSPVPAVCPACPVCRLVEGDELELDVGGAAFKTRLGNVAVVAVGTILRYPGGMGPPEPLGTKPIDLNVKMETVAALAGWGFGPMVGAVAAPGGGGWFVGAIAATPPVRLLFGLDGSLVAGGGGGPNGVAVGWAAGLIR